MIIFGITRHNCIGKYDEFHPSLDSAVARFTRLSGSMPRGDRLILLEINLGVRKNVRKLKEFSREAADQGQPAGPSFIDHQGL